MPDPVPDPEDLSPTATFFASVLQASYGLTLDATNAVVADLEKRVEHAYRAGYRDGALDERERTLDALGLNRPLFKPHVPDEFATTKDTA